MIIRTLNHFKESVLRLLEVKLYDLKIILDFLSQKSKLDNYATNSLLLVERLYDQLAMNNKSLILYYKLFLEVNKILISYYTNDIITLDF